MEVLIQEGVCYNTQGKGHFPELNGQQREGVGHRIIQSFIEHGKGENFVLEPCVLTEELVMGQ